MRRKLTFCRLEAPIFLASRLEELGPFGKKQEGYSNWVPLLEVRRLTNHTFRGISFHALISKTTKARVAKQHLPWLVVRRSSATSVATFQLFIIICSRVLPVLTAVIQLRRLLL